MNAARPATHIEITASAGDAHDDILTPDALAFLAALHRRHDPRRRELLATRHARHAAVTAGGSLDFLPETTAIRDADWRVAPVAPGLRDRRVEITGPTDAKMTINALNSGAKVWLADFEDANTPLWMNMISGQRNLRDAIDDVLTFTSDDGRTYALRPKAERPTIVVRPRGWHLPEKHVLVDGAPIAGALLDFGLYFFHSARRQIAAGSGPYFYLPKTESHMEARLWNDVFATAQELLGIPYGTIRATVLIETVPAAFEMDEILYELRDHSAGLNAGRWDYLFSLIKVFRNSGPRFLLPDRNAVTMTAPMMRTYTNLLVHTCHRRAAHAIGGMAAFIPSRHDAAVNHVAMAKVRDDKTREAGDGFDGSWVAHPDLVPLCDEVFTAVLGNRPNQVDVNADRIDVPASALLDVAATPGEITEEGLRTNISVALQYLSSWLRGSGAVAIFNLMEDAATAEICRSQIWQWMHNEAKLSNGQTVTRQLVTSVLDATVADLGDGYGPARELFEEVALADGFVEFLTLPAYERMP